MVCSEAIEFSPTDAYRLLLKAAMAIPTWHYLVAVVIVFMGVLYNFLELHFFEDLFTGFRGSPVLLTFHPSSQVYDQVASKCSTLRGRYLATPWLSSPHIQTSLVNFLGRAPVFNYKRQIFNTSDGGRFALDWLRSSDVSPNTTPKSTCNSEDDTIPIMVVIPGLTSDSASPYMKHLAFHTAKGGWNVVISNHRGLGGISVTSDCFYNAGWTEDIRALVEYLHQTYPLAPLFVVGTSIGANILVKYLGEDGENVAVAGAAAICSPWDLLIGSRFIRRRFIQKLYDRAITIGLQGYAQLHQLRYSRLANWEGIEQSRSIREFDTHATCHVGEYETVDTYYRHCSSSTFVGRVSTPLLCIGALDDPLCTSEAIPWDECRANRNIVLAMTKHGGHLAFFEGIAGSQLWWVRAVNEFLRVLHNSALMHQRKKKSPVCHSALMESSIDQGPYVNVADGMVAAMGTEPTADDAVNESSEREKIHGQTFGIIPGTEQSVLRDASYEHNPNNVHSVESDADSKGVKSVARNMVKRCLNQLSVHNKRSTWLLLYIAIVSTWPLVGTAFKFLIRRKFKKILPAKL